MNIDKFIEYFNAPKVLGLIAALVTLAYILYFTFRHHKDLMESIKGEDNKMQFIEALLSIWLILFVAMIVSDFALGLHASEEAWWAMDSVFAFGVAGGVYKARTRSVETKTNAGV